MNKKTTEQFIVEAKACHDIEYDYSKTIYTGRHKKVCIICPKHGEFWQEAGSHLKGANCPKCPAQYSQNKFILEAKKIHGDYYNYDKVKYVKMTEPVIITCPNHGDFKQKPYKHIRAHQGCPLCSGSKGEKYIFQLLTNAGIKFISQYKMLSPKIAKKSNLLIVDFFIELNNKQYIIEYNGQQHYSWIPHLQKCKNDFLLQIKRDEILRELCKNLNINLLEIRYDEPWKNIPDLLNRFLEIDNIK